jgi:hypothetical protein
MNRLRHYLIACIVCCLAPYTIAGPAPRALVAPLGDIEFILLPIAFQQGESPTEVHGAHETIWRGEVWVSNRSGEPVRLNNWYDLGIAEPWPTYPAGYVGFLTYELTPIADPGVLLTPLKAVAGSLTFSNRIFEVSRHAQPQGLEIPVVRQNEFHSDEISLLGFASGAGVRSALRVYAIPDSPGQTNLQVRADFIAPDGTTVATTTLTPAGSVQSPLDLSRPGYAAIYDLASAFPVLQTLEHFHVRLTPISGTNPYWAMGSVTDNDTQQVLIITPQ